ncbi:hypothetical protein GCM10028809_59750 [Spirosoma gilvum]
MGLFIMTFFTNLVRPWQQANAIETCLAWGGLANLPPNADDLFVRKTGNLFTRGLIVEFSCQKKAINQWIEKSYGLKGIQSTITQKGLTEYKVLGKKGAIGGKIEIDKKG